MRRWRYSMVLPAALALTACAHQAPRPVAAVAPAVMVPALAPVEHAGYALDTGDRLRIVVFGQDALSNTYTVDAAGAVTMPLIGAVAARGLTTRQLAGAIATRLRQKFLRDPYVAVEVDTYRPFFVLGEVTYPGQYPYVPNMTVEAAVAIAGGFTPRAYKYDVKVTRKFHGIPERITLPMQSAVRPGDTITVKERWF
jgi:polysaccharide biosynthesis/export protein